MISDSMGRRLMWLGAVTLGVAAAASAAEALPVAIAHRATGAIHLDGRLTEPDWEAAPSIGPLTQSEPIEGRPATESTDVRVLFDDDAI